MEEKKQKSLSIFAISKRVCHEILIEGQIASSGAHQARLLEKFKKNSKYIKHQFLALKFVFAFLFVFLPILPLTTFLELQDDLGLYSSNSISFISSFMFGIYFGMTFLYLLMFGMISTSSFMSGTSFKWLHTLPFSKKDIRKIGMMALFRNLDIPLIVLIAGFPIIMLIGTQNFIIFLTSLLASFLNVLFNFCLLIIIGEKLSFLFSESKGGSKKVNLVRILTMIGYFTITFGSGIIFTVGFTFVDTLLETFISNEPPITLNIILSLIPFPFAPAYFVSLSTNPFQVSPKLLLSTLIGFGIFILITWGLLRTAIRALRSTISTEIQVEKVEKKEVVVKIKPTSPLKAYIRKDLVSTTRDFQSFMFIFFPIFYPLVMVFTLQGPIISEVTTIEGILILWSIVMGIYLFIPPMLVVGFLNIEESGSSTIASLPISPRDQAKAKIILMFSIQGISLAFISIILTLLTNSMIVPLLFLATLPIAWTFLLLMFVLKIHLFGKMKYKYIIEELYKENKISKWILMILIQVGLYLTILIIGILLLSSFNISITILILMIAGIISLSILIFSFTRMFPKVQKMAYYKTGGFLRNNPILGGIALTILYFIFLNLAGFAESLVLLPFINILTIDDYIFLLFLDFFLQFGFLAIFLLLIVPKGLKLPDLTYSLKDYSERIHLKPSKPIIRNILVGVGSFIIFGIVVINGAIYLGHYVFDLRILFGNPGSTGMGFGGLGWFLFIFMLIPGIWEEIAYRGVVIPMLVKKYHIRTSLIISSFIFGFAHAFNLISLILIGADPLNALISVSFQVIYTTLLGVALGYMYIKTRTLLPSIILHYLIDSVGQIFFNTYITNIFLMGVFQICFLGLIPAILIILLVKVAVKHKPRNQDFLEVSSF